MADPDKSSSMYGLSPRRINSIDVAVGQRVKLRRVILGLSQEELGKLIGISFQQLQKYENGHNRISAGRLFELAKALNAPVAWFFETTEIARDDGPKAASCSEPSVRSSDLAVHNFDAKEMLELMQLYLSVTEPDKRKRLMRTIRFMTTELDVG